MASSSWFRPSLGDMDQTIVAVKIGPEKKVFSIHKDIICHQSPYFKAALSENWQEGQENAITLENAELDIFQDIVMEWLYTGKLPELRTEPFEMVKAIVFADRFDVPELRKDILARLHDRWEMSLPRYKHIIYAFDNLPESSKLCEMMVDLYGSGWMPCVDDEKEKEERQNLPVSFLLRLMTKLGERNIPEKGMPGIGHYRESAQEG